MSFTQTVEIPVNHRLTIDVPPEVPVGQAEIRFFPVSAGKEPIQRSEARDIELFRSYLEGNDGIVVEYIKEKFSPSHG
jgi:hypothetical protein